MPIEDEDEEYRNFLQRHPGLVLLAIVLVIATAMFFMAKKLSGGDQGSSRQQQQEVMIRLPPPPPPQRPPPTPPPTSQPTPPPDEKMVEQPQVKQEAKPEAPKAPSLGTSITGPGGGPDMGLGSGLGDGNGSSGAGSGSKYGWYASEVQNRIADAVRNNPRARKASLNVIVRIWPDSTGRIMKVRVSGTSADPALAALLQNEVLTGLQLTDPPPADMPLPIVMRLTAQRP